MTIKEEILSYKILYRPNMEIINEKSKEIFEIYELEERIKLKKVIQKYSFNNFILFQSLTLFI